MIVDRRHRVNPGRIPNQPRHGTSDYLKGWRDGHKAAKAGKAKLPPQRGGRGGAGGGGGTPTKKGLNCSFVIVLVPAWPLFLAVHYARRISSRRGGSSRRPAVPVGAGPLTGAGRHPQTPARAAADRPSPRPAAPGGNQPAGSRSACEPTPGRGPAPTQDAEPLPRPGATTST